VTKRGSLIFRRKETSRIKTSKRYKMALINSKSNLTKRLPKIWVLQVRVRIKLKIWLAANIN